MQLITRMGVRRDARHTPALGELPSWPESADCTHSSAVDSGKKNGVHHV